MQRCIDLLSAEIAVLDEQFGEECATAALLRNSRSYGEAHKDVIARWGRFPHRNATLGRASTPEEAAGLADGSIKSF